MKGRNPGLSTLRKRLAEAYDGPPPVCPAWLDDEAKLEWNRIVEHLKGVLSGADESLLATYCQVFSQWKKCELIAREDGLIQVDSKGNLKLHPAAGHATRLLESLNKIGGTFGMSPVARSRAGLENTDTVPEMDDFEAFQKTGIKQ